MSAITKMHEIHVTLNKAIDYILNPDKTDGCELVTAYKCNPFCAATEMEATQFFGEQMLGSQDKYVNGQKILAYHFTQSFDYKDSEKLDLNEITRMGYELAMKYTGGKHQFVVATHIDKRHIHNHIIFNARSHVDHKQFRCPPCDGYYRLRDCNDEVFLEHGLTQEMPERKNKYKYPKNISFTEELSEKLNNVLLRSSTFEEFLELCKMEDITINQRGKNAVFKLSQMKYNRRGSAINALLYKDFATIKKAIESGTGARLIKDSISQNLADKIQHRSLTSKLKGNKELAAALNFVKKNNFTKALDFEYKLEENETLIEESEINIKIAEEKIGDLNRIASWIKTMEAYGDIYNQYLSLPDAKKNAYRAKHNKEIESYMTAKAFINEANISSTTSSSDILSKVNVINEEISALKNVIKAAKGDIKELQKHQKVIVEALDSLSSQDNEITSMRGNKGSVR